MKAVLFVFAFCVLAVRADFPRMRYYIQNLWGCPGEYGANTRYNYKCNQYLQVQSNEWVKLSKNNPSEFDLLPVKGKHTQYKIVDSRGRYLSYHSKVTEWVAVDASDNYMIWDIRPRGNGFVIKSLYNCPSWPCNQELTTGNQDEMFTWLENGFYHDYRIIPAE